MVNTHPRILVTGGCGYIGSHTLAALIAQHYEVLSVDNLSRANEKVLDAVHAITGVRVKNYPVDLADARATAALFKEIGRLDGVIHFAAYKSVAESMKEPIMYFRNNLQSTANCLEGALHADCKAFVFSSSCSVYGNASELPVKEDTPLAPPESPYAFTKLAGEGMVQQIAGIHPGMKASILRYFNPAGAHESGLLGEVSFGTAIYLIPVMMETAMGKRSKLTVYGNNYNTRDGTCVRDFIHIQDLAEAHILALNAMLEGRESDSCSIYNLGTGRGTTVLEAIRAYEIVSGSPLTFEIADRRPGDVEAIFADYTKARHNLGWEPQRSIEDIMRTALVWEQRQA